MKKLTYDRPHNYLFKNNMHDISFEIQCVLEEIFLASLLWDQRKSQSRSVAFPQNWKNIV